MKGYIRFAWFLFIGMALLFLDFVSKAYIFHFFPFANQFSDAYPYGGVGVFKNFMGIEFSISLAINRGAAWGIFSDFQLLLVGIRILVVLGMIFYLLFVNNKRFIEIPFVLIITGAIGNILDFFLYGFVIDFIHFKFWGYDFPLFNLADSLISIGVLWLLVVAFLLKRREKNAATRS